MNIIKKIKEQEKIVKFLNEGVDVVLKEQVGSFLSGIFGDKRSASDRLQDISDKLDKLEIKAGSLSFSNTLPFNQIYIKFKEDYDLDIESLSSPEFQRTLKGTMYFSVVGSNDISKTIDLKTSSFPNTIIIRINYDTLDTYKDQYGDANLIYSKYGSPNKDSVSGDKSNIFFTIIEKK